jgi:hypothetical protein
MIATQGNSPMAIARYQNCFAGIGSTQSNEAKKNKAAIRSLIT